jgi:hypothetical protein
MTLREAVARLERLEAEQISADVANATAFDNLAVAQLTADAAVEHRKRVSANRDEAIFALIKIAQLKLVRERA